MVAALAGCDALSPKAPKVEKPSFEQTPGEAAAPPPYTEISIKSQTRRVPVIMYHDVVPVRTRQSQWFDCSVEEFEEQMAFLSERGAVPISLQDLYLHLTQGKDIPETAVVLTFDDNYQGFYDNAWPILKRYNFPAAMFVHTGFVGNKEGNYPKMDWDTLRELVKDPLFTVGGHTISHPDDMALLSAEEQTREMTVSKADLEKELGVPIEYFAYPNGKGDEMTWELARAAGYKMAFTIKNGLAEESPGIMAIHRYVHTRLEKAWEDRERHLMGGAGYIFRGQFADVPIQYRTATHNGVKLSLITGGKPETVTSESREGVRDFVDRTGAQAGINGTFFALAAIKETDNRLVGPCLTPEMTMVIGDEERSRWDRLRNRPVVMWGPTGVAIVPYNPDTMRLDSAFRDFMPDVQNVFMGGVWLVANGVPRTREEQNVFGSSDIQDFRRRAAFGIDGNGAVVFATSRNSRTSEQFAVALADAGVVEAVLLDSGFSTSLVLGENLLASGHSNADHASRPVPHAIVSRGVIDEASLKQAGYDKLPEPTKFD